MASLTIPKKPGAPFPETSVYGGTGVTSLVVSAVPAVMVQLVVQNLSANARYVHILNASSLPADGANPLMVLPLPASGAVGSEVVVGGTTGIVVAISTTAETLTLSADEAIIFANLQES